MESRKTETDLTGGAVDPRDEGPQLGTVLAPVADTVEAPGVFDVCPPVHCSKEAVVNTILNLFYTLQFDLLIVVVMVGGYNLTILRYLAGCLADVGEVVSGDDFNIGNTAVGDLFM